MKLYVLIFVFLLSVASAYAEPSLSFIDNTGNLLHDMIVHLSLKTDGISDEQVVFMHGKTLSLNKKGSYEGTFILDDPLTEAPDYAYYGSIEILDANQTLIVFPITFVKGEVYDTSQTLVKADLHFECDTLTSFAYPKQTDKYGSFTTYIPTGTCLITASANNMRGKIDVEGEWGQSVSLEIILNTKIQTKPYFLWIISGLLLVGILLFFLRLKPFLTHTMKRKHPAKKEHPKLQSVLKTLYPAEQEVVRFLGEHPETTSAVLRHALKIPRTSLARLLERLAVKKIVELERHGKMKKVRLASWLR
ncbi:MAG: hypothetical protein AABX72_00020 [Nanoarchaeota archaeon]